MALPNAQDHRRASEPELIDAIRSGEPLALAEAYHRAVPAAHAVARRLVPEAAEVEEVLLKVFSTLWQDAPQAAPLEAWVRRTTWAAAAERLRADGRPPASPSASGLLPDLPAPDVRFLDAAERAIADLPDDERRALLLAHDKGVASSAQEPGADDALVRALLALAGPETSSGDRQALEADGCDDLTGMGDWCLGIADPAVAAAVQEAIDTRGGCAARSRAVRRGRRRIEGLPATPDMGHRVLVQVLTSGGRVVAGPTGVPVAEAAAGTAAEGPSPEPEPAPQETLEAPVDAVEQPTVEAPAPSPAVDLIPDDDDPFADLESSDPSDEGGGAVHAAEGADPVADTADLPGAATTPVGAHEAPDDDEVAAAAPAADGDWMPTPGDTAELRLSDILAEGDGADEDDDPFAALDQPDEPAPPRAPRSPYAALEDLGGGGGAEPAPLDTGRIPAGVAGPRASAAPTDPATDVYVEGQDLTGYDVVEGDEPAAGRGALAAALAWILPILGGLAVGILLAVQVFGPPSG